MTISCDVTMVLLSIRTLSINMNVFTDYFSIFLIIALTILIRQHIWGGH